jgi:superfamily II DNA or RNA helicase
MLNDINYPKSGAYHTGTENEPINFFADVLPNSTRFDILLGYFSSSAIRVLALGFTKFLLNGGRCRFIINHILSEQDKAIILRGGQGADLPYPLADYERLKASLDSEGIHFFNCLAWLIAEKRVEIVAIRAKNGQGIAHQKTGIFTDGANDVLFSGSCNFTAMALLGNIENLSTRLSWDNNPRDIAAIEEEKQYFNQIFDRRADFVEYLNVEDIETAIQNDYGNRELNDLLTDEQTLIEKQKEKLLTNPKFKKRLEALEKELEILRGTPRFPYAEPRDYQKQAHLNWVANNKQGILAMATGTGKTLTALNCLLEEWRETGVYRAVILVPTIALVEQWEKEVLSFNMREVIKVSSRSDWRKALTSLRDMLRLPASDENFVIICTYVTFKGDKFWYHFSKLPPDTLLIADEAHGIASPSVARRFDEIHLQKRIALSATPKRVYDPEGSAAMETFFNDREPYTYNFDMQRAIDEKILCQYRYYPHIVRLRSGEMKRYIELTKQLRQHIDPQTGKYRTDGDAKKILMQRKQVIQKAANKLDLLSGIIETHFKEKGNLKYTFVYVPEGFEKTYEEDNSDNWQDSNDDVKLIDLYTRAISEVDTDIRVSQFVGGDSGRDALLRQFERGDIHVLASMKCLDEGVDVPRAEFAIFCSSTGNPRQFIQRRGRILRKHKEKDFAVVHDLIVVPDFVANDTEEALYKIERRLIESELERVAHFAFMAQNKGAALDALSSICEHYNLSMFEIKDALNR